MHALVVTLAISCGSAEVNSQFAEILKVDPFSNTRWEGDAISIYGLHVGQNRNDALAAVIPYGAALVDFETGVVTPTPCASNLCALDAKQMEIFSGITVRFSSGGTISQLRLGTIPYEMADNIKSTYYDRFQGSLRRLLANYSRDFQRQILGNPSIVERSRAEDRTRSEHVYHYANRGMTLLVQLPEGKDEQIADLTFVFCKPSAGATRACVLD